MLETKELVKVYRPKKGVPVKALDGVSLKFPDKGMVFLLGKSGSGKSTLLNVLGGLDRYNSGEILIKGVSSKQFRQTHFDSYRNTYVGFIFQEYNILEEYSVGANIALALQLQGKKATDETINQILHQVDLDGYGNRKPNELSGGQKQRVAIARALVKSPEIIMADEPTGALDSATGKQVLETLRKLSKEKLVIVVSHDRDFAEKYADRIIELADGKVIRDVTRDPDLVEEETKELKYEGNTVTVPEGYHLTEEDRIAINAYLASLQGSDLTLSVESKEAGIRRRFRPTKEEDIQQQGGTFRLIRSRLPFRFAFPMGASGLKHKKVRLFFTILLSCIAFGLFGLADTFASYDHVNTTAVSLIDSEIRYAAVEKNVTVENAEDKNTYTVTGKLTDDDLNEIQSGTGVRLQGVYCPSSGDPDFSEFLGNIDNGTVSLYSPLAAGITEIDQETLTRMGAEIVAGELPSGDKNEIALSTYLFSTFREFGYRGEDGQPVTIRNYDDMIGKTLWLCDDFYTVTAIVETGLELDRYELLTKDMSDLSEAEFLLYYALRTEFEYAVKNSLAGIVMVGDGTIDRIRNNDPFVSGNIEYNTFQSEEPHVELFFSPYYLGKLSNNGHLDILWMDGTERTELAENEIVIPASFLENNLSFSESKPYAPDVDDAEGPLDWSKIGPLNVSEIAYVYDEKDHSYSEIKTRYRIVGIVLDTAGDFILAPDSYVEKHTVSNDGIWRFAIGTMPTNRNDVRNLVRYCYENRNGTSYAILNPVCFELNAASEILDVLATVFLWIGVGFAVFAALLLSNFISTSISYKKQQIGILRAIGSRGNDVFRIFFSESFIIAIINFVLSAVGTFAVTLIINHVIRTETGLLITLLTFGIRQVLLLFAVSIVIAAIASFLPVKKIASKKPIDAIRDR